MTPDCWKCKHMTLGYQPGSDFCTVTGRTIHAERSRGVVALLIGGGCGKQGRTFEAGTPRDPYRHLAQGGPSGD